jgi:hypothetical protein
LKGVSPVFGGGAGGQVNLTIKADCADLREKCETKPILLKTLEEPENRPSVPNKANFHWKGRASAKTAHDERYFDTNSFVSAKRTAQVERPHGCAHTRLAAGADGWRNTVLDTFGA